MIKLKDILRESINKNTIQEDGILSKVFNRFRKTQDTATSSPSYSGDPHARISIKGNWKLFDFEEGTPSTWDDLDFSSTRNFVSKINSHPKMQKLGKNVGSVDGVIAKTTFKPGTGENTGVKFQIRIPDSKRTNKFHYIYLSSSKPFSSWKIEKSFDWSTTDKYIPSEYDSDIQEIAKFLFKELNAELEQRNYRVMEIRNR